MNDSCLDSPETQLQTNLRCKTCQAACDLYALSNLPQISYELNFNQPVEIRRRHNNLIFSVPFRKARR